MTHRHQWAREASQALRWARAGSGLTQAELADRLGWDQGRVARYETAETLPDLPSLAAAVEACGRKLRLVTVEAGGAE